MLSPDELFSTAIRSAYIAQGVWPIPGVHPIFQRDNPDICAVQLQDPPLLSSASLVGTYMGGPEYEPAVHQLRLSASP
jgi:hypothetical protein